MDRASTINFLSNEDTGKQACLELAPGFFFIFISVDLPAPFSPHKA
jgi:hypothetical protein